MKDIREKAERDAAYQAEQEQLKQLKEREWAKLRANQQRILDMRGERDFMRAQQEQERAEKQRMEAEAYVPP